MTIAKSIIIVILTLVISFLIGFPILYFGATDLSQHIVGLSGPISHLLTYSSLLVYIKYSKDNFSLIADETTEKRIIIIGLIFLIVIGQQLFDFPFFHLKQIANTYLGTAFPLTDYSNYEFDSFQLYRVFDAVILAPFFEEIIFRYYIFGGLLKKYTFTTAMLTSSVLFSLIHIDSPRNLIPTFVFGLVSSILYYRTKKIQFSILLHFIANLLWAVTVVFAKEYDQLTRQIGFGGLFWAIFLVGTFILIFGLKKITTANIT